MHRRANFIWKPDQKIDHEAYFKLVASAPLRREDEHNQWVFFRNSLTLPARPDSAKIKITCDGRYQLFINGEFVSRGPSRASPHFMRYDVIELVNFLHAGANSIAILVHSPGVDLAWYETTKGAWQPIFGDGGLYVELDAHSDTKTFELLSDTSWKCLTAPAWRQDAPRTGWGQDFIEDFDANLHPAGWKKTEFDDSNWPEAQLLVSHGDAAEQATGRGSYKPFPSLTPREIPQLAEQPVSPAQVIWCQSIAPRPDLDVDQRLYQEECSAAANGMFANPNGLLTADGDATIVTTMDGKDVTILLRFDPYVTGFPRIDIEAKGGEIIEVAAGEALPGEFNDQDPNSGLKRPDHLTFAHLFRYTAKPGRQQFEKFEFTAIRALQITVRNAPNGLKIHHAEVNSTNFPAQFDGAFSCNDPVLNQLWDVGRHTALQCMHDAFEDCPGREKRQWVGDGVVHLDIAEAAFGPSAYSLGRQFLQHAAESQRVDGLLQMYTTGDHRGDGVFIPDFTLHWIIGVEKYWLSSGDENLLEQLYPNIEKALAWFARQTDHNNLLANIPFWHFIEWADIGRNGESAPINALYAAALASASRLAKRIESKRARKRYADLSDQVKRALNARHWSENRQAYVDEVDPETGKQGTRISQQTNALMIAFDLAPTDRVSTIIDTISDEKTLKFTAAPPIFVHAPEFHEEKDVVRANTLYCHFLYEAYARSGRYDLVLDHMRNYYQPMLEAGATTLWESFEPSASLCHVFSATPVYQLSRYSLGVQPVSGGFKKVRFAPQFGDLDHADGAYPTPLGQVAVSWKRAPDGIALSLQAPADMEVEIVAPPGYDIHNKTCSIQGDRQIFDLVMKP